MIFNLFFFTVLAGSPDHSPGAPPASSSHAKWGTRMRQTTVQQAIVESQAASGHGSDLLLWEPQRWVFRAIKKKMVERGRSCSNISNTPKCLLAKISKSEYNFLWRRSPASPNLAATRSSAIAHSGLVQVVEYRMSVKAVKPPMFGSKSQANQ